MEGALERELRDICDAAGFSLKFEYATRGDMIVGIREIGELRPRATLTDAQGLALMENLRRAILRTASTGFRPSLEAQSRLSRWIFLADVSPEGRVAFVRVLTRLGSPVPSILVRGATQ